MANMVVMKSGGGVGRETDTAENHRPPPGGGSTFVRPILKNLMRWRLLFHKRWARRVLISDLRRSAQILTKPFARIPIAPPSRPDSWMNPGSSGRPQILPS